MWKRKRAGHADQKEKNRLLKSGLIWVALLFGFGVLGLAVCSDSCADIYKYIDPDGVVHFSNVPSSNGKWVVVIREKRVQFNLGQNFKKYEPEIWKASQRYSVDYHLVRAVIKAESNFNPNAVSRAGARGLMQLMPQTASLLQVNDSFHPEENIDGRVPLHHRFSGGTRLQFFTSITKGNSRERLHTRSGTAWSRSASTEDLSNVTGASIAPSVPDANRPSLAGRNSWLRSRERGRNWFYKDQPRFDKRRHGGSCGCTRQIAANSSMRVIRAHLRKPRTSKRRK